MNLYDILLDDLVATSGGNRAQIDETITQAANALGVAKWYVARTLGQALTAYATFGDSMHKLMNGAGHSQEQIEEVSKAIQRLAE